MANTAMTLVLFQQDTLIEFLQEVFIPSHWIYPASQAVNGGKDRSIHALHSVILFFKGIMFKIKITM